MSALENKSLSLTLWSFEREAFNKQVDTACERFYETKNMTKSDNEEK